MRHIDCNHIYFFNRYFRCTTEKKKDRKRFKIAENGGFGTIWPSADMPVPISVACLKVFREINTV